VGDYPGGVIWYISENNELIRYRFMISRAKSTRIIFISTVLLLLLFQGGVM
jgi:hypothetical protein